MSVSGTVTGFQGIDFRDGGWRERLEADSAEIEAKLPTELRKLHREVLRRASSADVKALILSGSTSRGRRTEISDLDYHVIGSSFDVDGLSRELDLHFLSEEELKHAVLKGDDFIQWSIRFGWVVFDSGVLKEAVRLIAEERPWPDAERKRAHAAKSMDLAGRFVASGDEDAALMQVRTAISLAARARLLAEGTFPLSRAELAAQLEEIGFPSAARALDATIYGSPSLSDLARAVEYGEALIDGRPLGASRSASGVKSRHPLERPARLPGV